MRYQGRLTTWHDDKGYGFVTPHGGGPRAFVHRNDFGRSRRPRGDELITYELVIDDKKRHNARNVQYVAKARPRGMPAVGAIVTPALALVFFAFLLGTSAAGKLPWAVPAWYVALSALTYFAYRNDKGAARRGAWRTTEQTLHALSLAGGWPGALVAQRWVRHKSKKTSFLVPFFVTAALNLGALAWLSQSGWALLRGAITHLGG